ncbi:MAG: plastocyanin/azurin family copper-binding protein [archaeon]
MRPKMLLNTRVGAVLGLLAVLLVAGCASQPTPNTPPPATSPPPSSSSYTVEITSAGYSPSTVTVKAGDTVTWLNMDSTPHWIASASHPTHTVYPEPGGCIGSKFDACKGLAQGESWSFTFDQKGSWNYHDHLNAQAPFFGKVIVE